MDLNKAEYKRLGDYIREVDVRNRDLKVTNLLGLSMTKQFRPSTSNIVGVGAYFELDQLLKSQSVL